MIIDIDLNKLLKWVVGENKKQIGMSGIGYNNCPTDYRYGINEGFSKGVDATITYIVDLIIDKRIEEDVKERKNNVHIQYVRENNLIVKVAFSCSVFIYGIKLKQGESAYIDEIKNFAIVFHADEIVLYKIFKGTNTETRKCQVVWWKKGLDEA